MNAPQLVPVLQTAIGPVILISGVGLLLLSMTNRLGRAIDRARALARELPKESGGGYVKTAAEIRILWSRAQLIRMAITLAATSALAAAVLVISLFLTALNGVELPWLIAGLFIACMITLIASLVIFIHDINRSLHALKLEVPSGVLDGPGAAHGG